MKILLYIYILFSLACGCSSSGEKKPSILENREGIEPVTDVTTSVAESETQKNYSHKVINHAVYTVRILSALDFLARKNEQVSPADKLSLQKETVVMLEIESPNAQKDFFDFPEITMSKEEGMQYLVGGISSDLSLYQKEKEFLPTGVSFERGTGVQNKIRVLFFFKDVDLNKKIRIKYFDRILNAGIINFGINK